MDEKAAPVIVPVPFADPTFANPPPKYNSGVFTSNPLVATLSDAYLSFSDRRAALGLSNPGTVEGISREVTRDVFLNNLMFSGFRAEFIKAFSATPFFQTAHSFAMGGNGGMPPYSFAGLYGSPRVFFQGQIDNEFQLSARANYRWTPSLVSKSQISLAPGAAASQSMVQLETDYTGSDFSANVKCINPSILDSDKFTGVVIGSYLQSVTPSLALGLETMWNRQTGEDGPQTMTSYAARYKGLDWIGSAQLLSQGGFQGSYWRRLSDRVEAGLEINLSLLGIATGAANAAMMGIKNEGTATIGVKYDFRTSVFRGQVDSAGKVSAVLEKRLAQMVQFTFAGEMDHSKNAAKIGMAVQIESAGSDDFMEAQERAAMTISEQPPPPF